MDEKARLWHQKNKMPKSPSLKQRIAWHKAHKKNCACREVPESIKKYLTPIVS